MIRLMSRLVGVLSMVLFFTACMECGNKTEDFGILIVNSTAGDLTNVAFGADRDMLLAGDPATITKGEREQYKVKAVVQCETITGQRAPRARIWVIVSSPVFDRTAIKPVYAEIDEVKKVEFRDSDFR